MPPVQPKTAALKNEKPTPDTIRVSVIGSTGYVGQELVRLLLQHPNAKLVSLTSQSYVDKPFSQVYPQLADLTDLICEAENFDQLAEQSDVIFLALPHGHAAEKVTPAILEKAAVIDMGADFRLKDAQVYEQWYGLTHASPALLTEAVYGLSEFFPDEISTTRLVANPGCYPTCSALTILPLLQAGLIEPDSLVIDAKSGITGAGRKADVSLLYTETAENIKAYGVAAHRHTPEIEQTLSTLSYQPITLSFTPHLTPMNRGILITAYAKLSQAAWHEADIQSVIQNAYETAYADQPFVRLCASGKPPETRWVKGSNFCDVGFKIDPRTQRVVMMGAIDNLVKGAAGQGIQNMNLMMGLPQETGILTPPVFPA